MTWRPGFEAAVADLAARMGPAQLRAFADRIAAGWPHEAILQAVPVPGFAEAARPVLAAQQAEGVTNAEAAAYLRGVAAGHAQHASTVRVESVWSGPSTHAVPVRATAQVLVELVSEAENELLLMTYSAKPYPPLLDALAKAVARGVSVTVVVETLQGAGSALAGQEPAAAFASVPGLELWHWPVSERPDEGAKMHAKLAVADQRLLLVTSANLTQSGVDKNIEAGLLVRGGTAPQRAAEHITELRARGVLARLR
ncbi:endonuclease [Carbonactinospora thermoautotrophica]|uniref:phospholipase D n=1 Tax=Carbonactinospora thermoautotrophica TaxID=1469144 RepID=A0A132N6E1_9ACTN|nr:DISARM system phospholipase D-like protein DrmC [Carbonactinospora thermoautotrophica]KWX01243.1 Phosphatidylserine/phosphatidylglycerophosphate/ cardiolipinsynthase-like protein [Carbonactinospora thermoautotrophica]KWX05576.1 endonuclease [Carbonactinospora thermoautotrophica]KWX08439.1 endonuclease [Carbonactinospora thermoautotrophica]